MREDVSNREVLENPADVVASAPASQDGFVKVKKILN
jgi:Asp-tRNA(Asn)/Glu-tRNA(Gln) amidotransferase C subunit